jgi:MFS family permease
MDRTKRNILFHTLDGVFFMGAMVFLDQFTIMTAFISNITDNTLIISLIPASLVLGFNVTGIFSVNVIQRIHRKHLFVAIMGALQRLMILALAMYTFALPTDSPVRDGSLAALFYFLFSAFGGFPGPAWLDLLARTVPSAKRAGLVNLRNSLGAGVGVVFPFLIAFFLDRFAFPSNYRYLFLTAFGFLVLSWLAFIMIKDCPPKVSKDSRPIGLLAFIKDLKNSDRNFMMFMSGRLVFSFAVISMSFYTVYFLRQNPDIQQSIVARFTLVMNISKVLTGLILGRIGDKHGNLKVLLIGVVFIVLSNILAWFFPSLPVFYAIYVFMGIIIMADINTYQAMTTEFGTAENRVMYAAVGNSLTGFMVGMLPIGAGALLAAGVLGFRPLFIICAAAAGVSFIFFRFFVKDPRHHRRHHDRDGSGEEESPCPEE